MSADFRLVGIDGGATKVAVWTITVDPESDRVSLGDVAGTESYQNHPEFIDGFQPVGIQLQLAEMQSGNIALTDQEKRQGQVILETFAAAIADVASDAPGSPLLIGIGMPGLKTPDGRGISALANGPRMPEFCAILENLLHRNKVKLAAPLARLGSDADYCGMGEEYAVTGAFADIRYGYYLGGGTGAADALKLDGRLIPLDQTKPWLAKTWEMKNNEGISLERFASAGGIQWVYSQYSGISVEVLLNQHMHSDKILEHAALGEPASIETFQEVASNLAMLVFERLTTLYRGWTGLFDFVNPAREQPSEKHPFLNQFFERVIFGQRLGTLWDHPAAEAILQTQFRDNLTRLILDTENLSREFVNHYCPAGKLRQDLIATSSLREAPALGAGIDALQNRKHQVSA